MTALQKLLKAQFHHQSRLCIGLDSELSKIPIHIRNHEDALLEYNREIIFSTQQYACAYKLNTAFYEQYGSKGWNILKDSVSYIPQDILSTTNSCVVVNEPLDSFRHGLFERGKLELGQQPHKFSIRGRLFELTISFGGIKHNSSIELHTFHNGLRNLTN